ncbi:hypothetical protein M8J77_002513 [Diaphorina citri]|nr:hypothetical protein M8J77_002513 [Diaphorina citri]
MKCEFERLLHEYRQNQLLISNIDHFYQIIYPVQLKNHEKMGISTREVASKYPNRGSHDNYQSSLGTKGRSRLSWPGGLERSASALEVVSARLQFRFPPEAYFIVS